MRRLLRIPDALALTGTHPPTRLASLLAEREVEIQRQVDRPEQVRRVAEPLDAPEQRGARQRSAQQWPA